MKEKLQQILSIITSIFSDKLKSYKDAKALKVQNAPPKPVVPPSQLAIKIKIVIDRIAALLNKIFNPLFILLEKLKKVDLKALTPKRLLAFFGSIITALLFMAKKWFLTMKPITIVGITSVGTFGAIIGINIYVQGNKIYEEGKEEIFGVKEEIQESAKVSRPKYYKQDNRQLEIEDFIIPIYIQQNGLKRSLRISVTVESSNRYIKSFLSKNEHLVRDRINASIEPILPEFQFSNEGKTILKEKIKFEINLLLKELKVDGEVDKVYFHSIIAD